MPGNLDRLHVGAGLVPARVGASPTPTSKIRSRFASLAVLALLLFAGPSQAQTAEPQPVLSGRVLDFDGRKPVAGATVRVAADPAAGVQADGEGRFRLPVTMSRRLELEVAAAGYLPKRVTIPGRQLVRGRPLTFLLNRAGTLRGKVVDLAGRPLAGAEVVAVVEAAVGKRLFDPSDTVADRGMTDAQGGFELRLLRPEQSYEVRASRAGAFPARERATVGDPATPPRSLTLVLAPARAARGRVQDPAGRPLASAEVTVRPALRPGAEESAAGTEGITVTSDEKGLFSIPECPAAEVELQVRKPGYASATLPALRIAAGAGPADLGAVTLRPGVKLAGRVVGAGKRAVPGAEVFVLDRPLGENEVDRALKGRKAAASTAADGSFAIGDLAQGEPVRLLVRAPGYLAAKVPSVRPPTAKPLLIPLETEAVLRGRVVDQSGEAVAGARIELRWQASLPENPEIRLGEPILREARAGADGRFELRGSPRGTVSLGVNAPGFVPIEGFEILLPRPAEAGELRLTLERGATLQGWVSTASGEPVPAVRVAAGGSTTNTDDDGTYTLEGVAAGKRDVLFIHPSYGRLVKPFSVGAGVNILNAAFDPGVEVTGRAVDENGKPVSGARILLASESRFELRRYQDVTGADGRFRLSPVVDGRYRLRASTEDWPESELPGTVVVAGEPLANLEITLDRGATLSGKVLGLEPADLAGVKVEARGDRGSTVAAWTDGQGRYEISSLHPGDWVVRATLWDGQRQVQARVPIARTDREVTRDLEFAKRLTLTAQVLFGEEPLPDAQVSLRGQRFAVERGATTDHEGRFRLDDLEADTYQVGVRHTRKMLVHNDQIELQGDREAVIRLEAATISGLVANSADGKPIAQASLSMRPLEGPEFLVTASTQADGRFTMYHVAPRRYRIEARAKGFAPAEQEVQVAGGEPLENLELRLTPTQGAKLLVRLASGQTPEFVHVLVRGPAGEVLLAESRRADRSGIVELTTLPTGTWEVFARAEGGALATGTLTVPSDPLSLTLAPAGRLRVRVPALATSDLIATLRLLGADGQPFWTLGPGGRSERQWTVIGGQASVDGLPAGAWTLQVEAADGQRWTGGVTASGLGEAAVTIE